MRLHLAATDCREFMRWPEYASIKYWLLSFYMVRDNPASQARVRSLDKDNLLIDSGAFAWMANQRKGRSYTFKDIEEYHERYIEFIKDYGVTQFMELDLDRLIGYERTQKLRHELERRTGRQCIPVFHKSRGLEDFHRTCQEYDYISIGTMVDFRGKNDALYRLLKIAESYGTRVHGLGWTGKDIRTMPFYSVDSTSWLQGSRFGQLAQFTGTHIRAGRKDPRRIKNYLECDRLNLIEWIKYQEYCDKNL